MTNRPKTREERLEWLRSLPGETISPRELVAVIGGDPYSYNIAANEGKLDLPHLWRGRNLRIWKEPVIRLIGGQDVQDIQNDNGPEGSRQDEQRGDYFAASLPLLNNPFSTHHEYGHVLSVGEGGMR